MQFKPGDIFLSKYEISNLIGTGAFGGVYKARDMKLDRTVAVKIMRSAQGTLSNFEAEIDAVKRLEHPNIARLYDFDVIKGGIPCLVMEFVDGRELGYILSTEGNFDFDRLGNVGLQVLDALVETHKLGIVHCDLKPENIMLTKSGARTDVVKLIDFGVASILTHMHGDVAKDRPLVGTPQYMAPEQIRRDNIGPWTDIYAVGLILIELWTGRIVFDHEDPREVLRLQLYSDVPLPAELESSEIGPVIRRAVEKDVANRYQNTLDFYNDLKNAIDTMKSERQWRKARAEKSNFAQRERAFPSIFEDTSGGSIFDTIAKLNSEDAFNSVNVKYDGRVDFQSSKLGLKRSSDSISLSDLDNSSSSLGRLSIPPMHADESDLLPPSASPKRDVYSSQNLESVKDKDNDAKRSSGNHEVVPEETESLNFGSITNSIGKMESGYQAGDSPMLRQKLEQNDAEGKGERPKDERTSGESYAARKRSLENAVDHLSHKSLPKLVSLPPKKTTSKKRVVVISVIAILLCLLCLGGVFAYFYTDLNNSRNWFSANRPTQHGTLVTASNDEEIPGVRRAALVDLSKAMSGAALTGSVKSAILDPRRIHHYDIIGTPLDAGIYIQNLRVCKTTPCRIHVYSDPSKISVEIRLESPGKTTVKSNTLLLSDHKDERKPILLSIQ